MSNEIKIKSDVFNEAANILTQINMSLSNSINKMNIETKKLASTWDSKSGNRFNGKNKILITNMKILNDGIGQLALELNNINSAYEKIDKSIAYKLSF